MRRVPAFSVLLPAVIAALLLTGCGQRVPELKGKTASQAEQALLKAGFKLGAVSYNEKSKEATWTVVSQEPAAGNRAASGSIVNIALAGPPPVAVPSLLQLKKSQALAALSAVGLTGEVTETWDASVPVGVVTTQTPTHGDSTPRGSVVYLVVSKGPQPVAVPSVTKKGLDEARKLLAEAGFKVQTAEVEDAAKKGTVLRQEPKADALLQPGNTVKLTVSSGVEMVTVPNIRGMLNPGPLLESLGLRPVAIAVHGPIESDAAGIGEAYRQHPAAGTSVPKGTRVTYHFWWEAE